MKQGFMVAENTLERQGYDLQIVQRKKMINNDGKARILNQTLEFN